MWFYSFWTEIWSKDFLRYQVEQKASVVWHSPYFLNLLTGLPSLFLCQYKCSVHVQCLVIVLLLRRKIFFFHCYVTFVPEGCGLIGLWTASHSTMSDKSCCSREVTQNQMLQALILPSTVLELHPLMHPMISMYTTLASLWHIMVLLSLHFFLVNELSWSIVIVN